MGLVIGGVRLRNPVVCAAMEEHSDPPYRALAKEMGAALVFTEMVRADELLEGSRRALRLLTCYPNEHPIGGQLCGDRPEVLAAAARLVEERGFDLVDLNFSCPTPRIVNKGLGGALAGDAALIAEAVAAVRAAVRLPVTLKLRSGPDDAHVNAVEVVQAAERAGCAGVIVHARTVAQAYRGDPDWAVIARVKAAVGLPVVGGGGIRTPEDARRLLRETGCDGAQLARGVLGNPWAIRRTVALLAGAPLPPEPSREERLRVLLAHMDATVKHHGEGAVLPRLPRLFLYYGKDLPGFNDFKRLVHAARGYRGLVEAAKAWFRAPA